MNTTVNNKMLYKVAEVADIMHTKKGYVYKLIKAGVLPAIKLGSLKVRHEALEDFLKTYEGKDLTDPFRITKYETVENGGVC